MKTLSLFDSRVELDRNGWLHLQQLLQKRRLLLVNSLQIYLPPHLHRAFALERIRVFIDSCKDTLETLKINFVFLYIGPEVLAGIFNNAPKLEEVILLDAMHSKDDRKDYAETLTKAIATASTCRNLRTVWVNHVEYLITELSPR